MNGQQPEAIFARDNTEEEEEIQIPGQKIISEVSLNELKNRVSNLLLLNNRRFRFPGSQPVSFCKEHIDKLKKEPWYAVEKTDGLRCLLFITPQANDPKRQSVFFITRKEEFYRIGNIVFPGCVHSLFDSELVLTHDKSATGGKRLRLLVFDALAFQNINIMDRTYIERCSYLGELEKRYMTVMENFSPASPFKVNFKKPMEAQHLKRIFSFASHDKYKTDGLIFTLGSSLYKVGTDENILKWKPPNLNSIDFAMNMVFGTYNDEENGDSYIDYDSLPQFYLSIWKGKDKKTNEELYQQISSLHVEESQWEMLKAKNEPLQGRIIECVKDEENRWVFLRFRDDKDNANHISTYRSVIQSIEDAVSEKDLLQCGEYLRHRSGYYKQVQEQQQREQRQRQQHGSHVNGAHRPPSGHKREGPEGTNGDRPDLKKPRMGN